MRHGSPHGQRDRRPAADQCDRRRRQRHQLDGHLRRQRRSGINTATFSTANLAVSNGATVTAYSANGNAVTYTITAPSGTWGASTQGTLHGEPGCQSGEGSRGQSRGRQLQPGHVPGGHRASHGQRDHRPADDQRRRAAGGSTSLTSPTPTASRESTRPPSPPRTWRSRTGPALRRIRPTATP